MTMTLDSDTLAHGIAMLRGTNTATCPLGT